MKKVGTMTSHFEIIIIEARAHALVLQWVLPHWDIVCCHHLLIRSLVVVLPEIQLIFHRLILVHGSWMTTDTLRTMILSVTLERIELTEICLNSIYTHDTRVGFLSAALRSNAPIMFYLCLLSAPLRSNGADYVLLLFIYLFFILFFIFSFTVRSQKLPDRFSPNFQELCILV